MTLQELEQKLRELSKEELDIFNAEFDKGQGSTNERRTIVIELYSSLISSGSTATII